MPSWFNWITNNIQVVFLVLFFVLPVVGKVLGHLQKAAKERQRKIQREREELDRLRTGRNEPLAAPMSESATRPVAMPKTVAQQKRTARQQQERAQVEATRLETARVEASRTQAQRGQRQQQTRLVRLPGGIVLEVPVEVADAPVRPGPTAQAGRGGQGGQQGGKSAAQRSRAEQRAQQRQRPAAPVAAPTPATARDAFPTSREVSTAGAIVDAVTRQSPSQVAMSSPAYAIRTPGVRRPAYLPQGRGDMRRAIVLSELLAPPLALREAGTGADDQRRSA